MELKINSEIENAIAKMLPEQYETLKQSIKEEGQKQPIEVMEDGTIVDGHHRYRICKELGITPKYKVLSDVKTVEDAKKYTIMINIARRHLNSFQIAEMGMELLKIERELAKQRQMIGLTGPREERKGKTLASIDADGGKATEIVAKKIGLSGPTFERAVKIIEKGSKQLQDLVREEKLSIHAASKLVTALEDVPEDKRKELEERVTSSDKPDEELVKVMNIIAKTNEAKGYLELTCETVAKEIQDKYKDLFYTEALDPKLVKHDIEIAEGVDVALKRVYYSEDEFPDEQAADAFAKKLGGRCLGKVTVSMWVLEVDPYELKKIQS